MNFFFKKKKINKKIIYGYDIDIKNLIFVVKQIPIHIENLYNLIIVKEAQYLAYNIENLYKLIINSNTILIICYNDKILDKNTKLYNKIKNIGTIYNSVKLKKIEIFYFIQYEIEKRGFIITNNAINLIIKYLGQNLYKINNEIKKILILLNNKKKIDEKFIKKNLLKDNNKSSKLELYIVKKDLFKSYKTIFNLKNLKISIVLNIIYIFFIKIIKFNLLKLNNFNFIKKKKIYFKAIKIYPLNKMENIISYIRESDTKIKNSSLKNEDVIKELLYKIFNN
ncbi:DNA polymerase III subunit delta [Candidatus Karelsulcia muelleri]|uniref:DNA polymerase III subunit delta n=1 Tax=Candidatus Karelsulcia muelleri TaxID=336810 RepID=UPI0035C8EBE3